MMMDMQKLDDRLAARTLMQPSAYFESRICSAARMQAQTAPMHIWLRNLFADFAMPRPAYAFASILMLGMIVGLGVPTARDASAESAYTDETGAML